MTIDTLEALRALYPPAKERALLKQLAALDAHCRRFVSLSPFVVLASAGADGRMDASPRGGPPGFVLAPDAHTLWVPDAPGNNRLDTLENVVATGRLGMLFMVPGVDETLRVNGDARLSTDPALLAPFADASRPPRHLPRAALPTMGEMLKDQLADEAPAESQAQMLARYAGDL